MSHKRGVSENLSVGEGEEEEEEDGGKGKGGLRDGEGQASGRAQPCVGRGGGTEK